MPARKTGGAVARGFALLVCTASVIVLFAVTPASRVEAASPEVEVGASDTLALSILVRWEQPLPGFVEDRLQRGIPATVGLRADLLARRSGWFDRRVAQAGAEWKLARDPWGESYLIADSSEIVALDSLPALRAALSRRRLLLPLESAWCDETTSYRVEVTAYVLPLSADDAGEVESWLKGQIRGLGRGILGIPKSLFGVVRDLSGLGERTSKGRSERFRLATLPGGRMRVVVASDGERDPDR